MRWKYAFYVCQTAKTMLKPMLNIKTEGHEKL